MTTPAEATPESTRTPLIIRPVREELETYAKRRLESLRRADAAEAERVEDAVLRALELLGEVEEDDDDLA